MKGQKGARTAIAGKSHGKPMGKTGAHQVKPMPKKVNKERKGTAKTGKLTAL